MWVFVQTESGKTFTLEVEPSDQIETVKDKIHRKAGISPEKQRLLVGKQVLDDVCTCRHYNIRSKSTIHLELMDRFGGIICNHAYYLHIKNCSDNVAILINFLT